MLSLHKVSHTTFSVNSSDQESLARSPAVLLRYQRKVELVCLLLQGFNVEIAKDAGNLERRELDMFEVSENVRVEGEVRYVPEGIRVGILHLLVLIKSFTAKLGHFDGILDADLQGLCQVEPVREEKWLVLLDVFQHLNERLCFFAPNTC